MTTNFICKTNNIITRGLYFRSPVYTKDFNDYDYDLESLLNHILKPKRMSDLVSRLLNRKSKLLSLLDFVKTNDNAAGVSLNYIRWPIYTIREVRTLDAVYGDLIIKSRGFNYMEEEISGRCVKEVTVITSTCGTFYYKGRTETYSYGRPSYSMTYKHNVREWVDSAMQDNAT